MTNNTPPISSKLILGARCNPDTEKRLRKTQPNASTAPELNFQVFEVTVDGQTRYCCASGGTMRDDKGQPTGNPCFTLVGMAALEALMNLPFANGRVPVFCEMKLGQTPLQEKIIENFRFTADTKEFICFLGDLAKELDGQIAKSFNFSGFVQVEECVAYAEMQKGPTRRPY